MRALSNARKKEKRERHGREKLSLVENGKIGLPSPK